MLNNIDAQIMHNLLKTVDAQIMYDSKIERCATVLQKKSKLTIVMRKRQSLRLNLGGHHILGIRLRQPFYVTSRVGLTRLRRC